MPKRTDIDAILIIGAGPIVIGQACEFDYSGVQALKVLKAEGYRVVLVNSNPATIMTDPDLADATYIEPITPEFVAKIIERERRERPRDKLVLLPTMGGQTALNVALALADAGILAKYDIEMIGAKQGAIAKAEDRQLFKDAMEKIGLKCPRARLVNDIAKAAAALKHVGLPAIIRPSFTLGGQGGGIATTREEFLEIVASGLDISPRGEVLVEQSVIGWKEFEMEVVRDRADNAIIVCSIENIDPMGVHTGDSITVAPALTLTDKEFQIMRDAAIACLREIGVETGGSNVQFAVNPRTGEQVIIEMNPRVSRSSALASKATGFPIAKVAAKLAVGYTLDEIENDITKATPASFEPAIDYVVTKIPRFAFEKFPQAEPVLTTSMKSVGEAMAIGRTFHESLQKALRSLETGLDGLNAPSLMPAPGEDELETIRKALKTPTPERLLVAAEALRRGLTMAEIHEISGYDPWFLARIAEILDAEEEVRSRGLPKDAAGWRALKGMGFSDKRLASLAGAREREVSSARREAGVRPVYKRIDTCAAEFEALTPYMYSTYEAPTFGAPECEARATDKRKVVILGGGPNRIGQGIEFDYCCCHAAFALEDAGFETIMVNCNPETVSTDYDTSDRLYFEPLTAEDVLELIHVEQSNGTLAGVIVQFGGQTPLKLAPALEAAGVPILGTSPDAIDLAEDRGRFQKLIRQLGLKQPANGIARSLAEVEKTALEVGLPIVLRPSNVLGGRGMQIVSDEPALKALAAPRRARHGQGVRELFEITEKDPALIDQYLVDAIEVDVDAVCDGRDVAIAGIMEHIEEAGVHSGDSACSLPPYSLSSAVLDEIEEATCALAKALHVIGLMNVQFAVQGRNVYVLEVNPRASRTVPFVAKATADPVAKIAARVMAGETLKGIGYVPRRPRHFSVKEAVFPFARFPGVDTVLGPEMRSTGEVMGLDQSFARAFAKSQLAGGTKVPLAGCVFISVKERDKAAAVEPARRLLKLGFSLLATRGTAEFLRAAGLEVDTVNKVHEGAPHIVDKMRAGKVQLVFNTTEGRQALADSFEIRRTALTARIPYYTTIAGARVAARAIEETLAGQLEVAPLQSYSH